MLRTAFGLSFYNTGSRNLGPGLGQPMHGCCTNYSNTIPANFNTCVYVCICIYIHIYIYIHVYYFLSVCGRACGASV